MGAMENIRVLLYSNEQLKKGIGNDRGLVGRYFMDHPWSAAATYVLFHKDPDYFKGEVWLKPSETFVRSEKIGTFYCGIKPYANEEEVICSAELSEELVGRFRDINCGGFGSMELFIEQCPTYESRISLSEDVDDFGNQRLKLDWNMSELDRRTLRRSLLEIGKYMADKEIGRVRLERYVMEEKVPLRKYMSGGHHHLGGLRMARSPNDGVVDENCKVFGIGNLFIAGSGVFPTGGVANPTFTIVKLALRLSDHLLSRN
jgi:choline dehydrogenase-like flavoprotein